jgi:hypothetical protein
VGLYRSMIDLFLLSFSQNSFLVICSYNCWFTFRILNSLFLVVAKLLHSTFFSTWWVYELCKVQYTQRVRHGKFSWGTRIYNQELLDMKRKKGKAFMKAAVMLFLTYFYHNFSNWPKLSYRLTKITT